jgi:hypothetical protein
MSEIFIQIASYRDSELVPTIRDCINKSSGENRLTFGVVWQKGEEESLGEFSGVDNVKVIDVKWYESKGLGWARSLTQSLYNGESYTMQLDSHHRFAEGWDKTLIDMYEKLKNNSAKPFITSYLGGYDPVNDKVLNPTPCKILPHDFKESGTIWFNPVHMIGYEKLNGPIRGILACGHFFFTSGDHCVEYKYDPDMYFAGDEITLSVRSYTLGYDIYHPHVATVWHHYGRNNQPKHWIDHNDKTKQSAIIDKTWGERDRYSKQRIRQLLGQADYGIDLKEYGLGDTRTLNDYEKYSGIDLKNKRIQNKIIAGAEPPVNYVDDNQWNNEFKKIVPVDMKEWPVAVYSSHLDQIDRVEVEFYSLQKTRIHYETIEKEELQNMVGQKFKTNVVSDHYPMRVVFRAMKDQKEFHVWERDLRPNIHWN